MYGAQAPRCWVLGRVPGGAQRTGSVTYAPVSSSPSSAEIEET